MSYIKAHYLFRNAKTIVFKYRAVFTWLSKGIGFGFGFGFTTPFGWLVYLLWFWFYDSQVKIALIRGSFIGLVVLSAVPY